MLRELLVWARSNLERVPRRYWLCLLAAINICVLNIVKNIEFRVFDRIVMVKDQPTIPYVPGSYSCPYRGKRKNPNYYQYVQFMWSSAVKDRVKKICLWAHVLFYLPCGIWADLYGGHHLLFWALIASSAITLLTPSAVDADDGGVFYFGMLVLRRLTAGPALPASLSLLAKWALPDERMTFVGIFCSGWYVGHSLGMALAISCTSWRMLYYMCSALTIFSAVLWGTTVRPWHEKLLPPLDAPGPRAVVRRVPLFELATAPRLVSLYLLAFASHGISLMVDPVILYYLREVLLSDFRDSLAARLDLSVPLLTLGLACPCLAAGVASDYLVSSGLLGRPAARRIHASVGCAGVALVALLVTAAACDAALVVGCYSASLFFNSLQRSLLWTAPMDAAPRLVGTLFALAHIFGCVGIKAKVAVVLWCTDAWEIGDLRVWATLFAGCALIIVTLPVPYVVWGPFYEFPWAKLDPTPDSIKSPVRYGVYSVGILLLISLVVIVVLMIF